MDIDEDEDDRDNESEEERLEDLMRQEGLEWFEIDKQMILKSFDKDTLQSEILTIKNGSENDQCPVCFNINKTFIKTCKHNLCINCLSQIVETSELCPVCRQMMYD